MSSVLLIPMAIFNLAKMRTILFTWLACILCFIFYQNRMPVEFNIRVDLFLLLPLIGIGTAASIIRYVKENEKK
jgi:hypothetical protein